MAVQNGKCTQTGNLKQTQNAYNFVYIIFHVSEIRLNELQSQCSQ